MNIRQGDIYWVDFGDPGESEPAYRRPCVVIQNDAVNATKIGTVIVCVLTSNLKRAEAPGNVFLGKGEGNLPKDSVANVSQILTVNKSDLVERIGSVPAAKVNKIIGGVKLLIEPREAVAGE